MCEQQIQPLFNSKIELNFSETSIESMDTFPNSFSMTTFRSPFLLLRGG
jgi:hypothetical protein